MRAQRCSQSELSCQLCNLRECVVARQVSIGEMLQVAGQERKLAEDRVVVPKAYGTRT